MEQTTLTAAKVFARDLCDGQEVDSVFVVQECNRRQKRNGDMFLKLQLGDASGRFECVVWDDIETVVGCASAGAVVRVTGHFAVSSRYGASLTARALRAALEGEYDLADLAEGPPVPYEKMAQALGDLIGIACTINEPQGLGSSGYLLGINPPGHTDDREGAQRAVDNLLEAHRTGAAAIRARYSIPVGVTLAMPDIQYEDGAQLGESSLEVESRVIDWFLELARKDEFIGVQTYTRFRIGPDGSRSPGHDWSDLTREMTETETTTQMGYEDYPQALGAAIRRAAKSCPGLPVLVTENGIATAHDERRIAYMKAALGEVQACLADGIDVRSYLYWSWLDNFEWAFGYAPTFGLVAVDRQTFARHPKPSAAWLGQVARSRALSSG